MRRLEVAVESWPIAGKFTISRGGRTEALVVVASIHENGLPGRGECVPYAHYNETVEGVAAEIRGQADAIRSGMTAQDLMERMPAGAARNALDCALWDLEAKRRGTPVWRLAGVEEPRPAITAYTLSLGAPEDMEAAARQAGSRALLKVKLGGDGDLERIAAVRRGAPRSALIVDANEAWEESKLPEYLAACAAADVKLIEQPLPAHKDASLANLDAADRFGIPICADESLHTHEDLPEAARKYQAVNIKLDKSGGLTEALIMRRKAQELGLKIMIGCMVGTSLAMAPAMLLASGAEFVDLDGPLLLAKDRDEGLKYQESLIYPPASLLWG